MLFRHPRGKQYLSWLRTIPNNGLIYLRTGLSSGVLLVTGQHALRDVLSTNSYDFVKQAGLRDIVSHFLGYALPTSEGVAHKVHRKAMAPAFTIKKIRTWYPLMWRKTQVFLYRLEQDIQAHPVPGRTSGQLVGFTEMRRWAKYVSVQSVIPPAGPPPTPPPKNHRQKFH
jgi:cytochrome P450